MRRKIEKECWFPGCNVKNVIHHHHITPREINPNKNNKLTIPLCPTCHSLIFHPLAKNGQHSIIHENSIEILNIYNSTNNSKVLKYKNCKDDKIYYYDIFSKTIIEE